jgi:hydroxymethylpyrimidine/phosphomethylpyrimidine kinase
MKRVAFGIVLLVHVGAAKRDGYRLWDDSTRRATLPINGDELMDQLPVVLTIAGSDSGGGAGIQADLKAIGALGGFGCTAITAVTAQNPQSVTGVWPVPPEGIRKQVEAVISAFPVAAIKTGMVGNAAAIEAVANSLDGLAIAIVVDPVMVATSGARLLDEDSVDALMTRLLPLATVITPNLPEAAVLLGREVMDPVHDARLLTERFGVAVLLKGGHGDGGEAVDVLVTIDGEVQELRGERVDAASTHGTGCTLAAALATSLANGMDLSEAAEVAKTYVTDALRNCVNLGNGQAALGTGAQSRL